MAGIRKVTARIGETFMLAPGICSMWIEETGFAKDAVPGQFISVYCDDKSRLLPRPISICEIDKMRDGLRIVYRIAGAGTRELSERRTGGQVQVMGPLGNGYLLDREEIIKRWEGFCGKSFTEPFEETDCSILIGGGIGIPPLLALAQSIPGRKVAVLGYRDSRTFLKEDFEACGCRVVVATDDGSVGMKGNVIDAIRADHLRGSLIYSCGPVPMQRGVKEYASKQNIIAQLSLEERMACGIGACLGCVCSSKDVDSHSHVHNKRVCKDGPVFFAEEIEL